MIDVKELMVGNILKTECGIFVKIDARSIFDIWDNSREYSPVPITYDFLRMLGFTEEGCDEGCVCYFEMEYNFDFVLKKSLLKQDSVIFSFNVGDVIVEKEFCYVHELQNFFYSLTGKDFVNPNWR